MQPESEYLIAIVKPLLRHPDTVTVTHTVDELGVLLTLTVHKEDMGAVVGKKGDTAKALRQLVRATGMVARKRVSIRINEPDGSAYQPKFDRDGTTEQRGT